MRGLSARFVRLLSLFCVIDNVRQTLSRGELAKIVLTVNGDTVTPSEAARLLSLTTPDVVYRLLRAGTIRGECVGGRWRIPRSEIERRKRAVAAKKSSPSYRERAAERRAAVRSRFEPVAGLPGARS